MSATNASGIRAAMPRVRSSSTAVNPYNTRAFPAGRFNENQFEVLDKALAGASALIELIARDDEIADKHEMLVDEPPPLNGNLRNGLLTALSVCIHEATSSAYWLGENRFLKPQGDVA